MLPEHQVIAVVDIGSNSIKLAIAARDGDGRPVEVAAALETVRLGAGLDQTGSLADDRIEAALAALHQFAADARAHGATRLFGVATEATRAARNGADFLQRVAAETGWDVRVVSGDEEAALTFAGLAATLDVTGPVIIADIGGASTELIVAEAATITSAVSFPVGSGRLTDRFVRSDPPTSDELSVCSEAAQAALAAVPLPDRPATRLIAVGGTGQYWATLLPPGQALTATTTDAILDDLTRRPAAELAAELGIAVARARVLPAGIAIGRVVIDLVRPGTIEVARSGIRTGLLLAAFAEDRHHG